MKRVPRATFRLEIRHRHRNKRTPTAYPYHYRPLMEPLERRRLLTNVKGVDPMEDSHTAQVATDYPGGVRCGRQPGHGLGRHLWRARNAIGPDPGFAKRER